MNLETIESFGLHFLTSGGVFVAGIVVGYVLVKIVIWVLNDQR